MIDITKFGDTIQIKSTYYDVLKSGSINEERFLNVFGVDKNSMQYSISFIIGSILLLKKIDKIDNRIERNQYISYSRELLGIFFNTRDIEKFKNSEEFNKFKEIIKNNKKLNKFYDKLIF